MCREHGRAVTLRYQQRFWLPLVAAPCEYEDALGFDLDLLLFDDGWGERQPLCQVYLVQVGGARMVGVTTGYSEGGAIRLTLLNEKSPRPRTHQAMAAAISVLGGRLLRALIDKFHPAEQTYEAKLHIRQVDTELVVDVRPSDAVTLALISDVPIMVSKDVLATLAGTP